MGKGKGKAAASHGNQKCEFQPVKFFSGKANSFQESHLFRGSLSPYKCDSGLGERLLSAIRPRKWRWHRYIREVPHWGYTLCFLHLLKFGSKTTHPNQNFLGQLSRLPLPSPPRLIALEHCTRPPSVSRTCQALSCLGACAPDVLSTWKAFAPVLPVFGAFSSFVCHLKCYPCELRGPRIPLITPPSLRRFTRFIITWNSPVLYWLNCFYLYMFHDYKIIVFCLPCSLMYSPRPAS